MKRKFILLAMMLLTLIGGVKFNVLNAQEQYRVKFPTLGDYYLTIFNNISHPSGTVGGVGVDVYQESNAQKFTIETGANGGVYLKSADGYYIYCNGGSSGWNVDAINGSDKSELYGFDMNGGSFKIYDDNGYIKVQEVNSAYYIFHDASSSIAASWQLEEVTTGGEGGDEPSGDVCTLELFLQDSYGDGWTGNKIVVANGVSSNEFTISSGITAQYTCDVVSGSSVTLSFVCGGSNSWPTECTWTIKYQDGDDIWSGTGSLDGSSHTFTASCEAAVMPEIPTGLVATAESFSKISLTWNEATDAKKYNVYQNGVKIAEEITETSYVVTNLTQLTEYCFTVTAINGAFETEHSDEICVTTPEAVAPVGPQTIAIGSGTNESGYLPVYTYYYYGYTQQIYTADELNFPFEGEISKIRFKQSNTTTLTRSVVIYMINTSKESFTAKNDWVAVTDADKVFEGSMQTGTSIVEVTLDKEFVYTGGNILLAIQDITGNGPSTAKFYTYNAENRAIRASSYFTAYGPSSIPSASYSYYTGFNNQIEFTIEIPAPTIEVNHTPLDFGTVRAGGDFWTEKETPSFDVNVTAKNTTIKSVSIDDDFFTSDKDLATAAGQAEFNFTVSYNKEAEAGEKSGNIVVTYMNGEEEATVEIPMTATAYVPAQGDVVENPKAITFTEGAYTDNVTGVYDDYILPGEENDGNNGDAVYTFTLTEESLISANVEGTNGLVAIYRAADLEGNGPSSENSFAGNENNVPEVSMAPTTFFNGFETGDFTGWQNIDGDGDGNVWQIAMGGYASSAYKAVSHSYTSTDLNPENYLITDQKYLITENSKLTVCATSQNSAYLDGYKVMVSETGEVGTFTEVEAITAVTVNDLVPYETDLSAYAGKEVYIAINHYTDAMWSLYIDNVELTDGSAKTRSLAQTRSTSPQIENVYPAGEYVLVAAAEGDFTFNITTGDIPAPEVTTYVSPENNATEVTDATLVFQLGKYTDEYQVLVGTSADALETVVDWTSELATTYTLADAANNTKYHWQVNTRNAKDVETTGEVWSFVTPLDVPQNVTATATELYQDNNTTTISWTEMEGLTYNVYVDGVKQNEEAVTATEYVLSDLAWSPEGHSVTVTANHGELGESPMSEAVVVKVAGTFTITVNAVEGATVALSYSEGATDEFGNQLEDVYTNVTTDVNGQAVFENVKLLGDWSAHNYEINVTKGLYNEEVYVIDNVTIAHDENYEVDVEMTLTTPNFNVSPEAIHVGESVTLTWDAIEAENVTYNVYVNGVKHNAEAITAAEYVISDLAYNMNPGNAVAVTAVHSLGETPQDPIYVQVAGTFTLTVNVTDGTNPIEGADIVITTLNSTTDEFANAIEDVTGLTTDENGQVVVPNMKVMKNGESGYMYQIIASKEFYNDGYENIVNYASYYGNPPANGDNVEKTITMQMVAPQNITLDKEHYFVGDDVVLTWEAPDFNTRAFLGYNVYQIANYEDITKLNEEPLTETSYTITGLEYGSYSFGVSAVYDEGESSYPTTYVKVTGYGEISGTVKDDNNEPIKGVSITVEGYNEFYEEVTYTATSDASGAFSIENVMLSSWEGYTLTATKFDYQEKVVTGIEVVYNTPTQCNVTMQTLPGGTFAVTASAVGENVEVTWDVPTGGVAYNVYRRFDGDVTPLTTEEITTQSFTDETWSTLADGEYEYGVSAKIEERFNFKESFANGIPADWKTYRSGEASTYYDAWIWKAAAVTNDGISAYDGDNGIAMANNNKGTGTTRKAYMVTSLIDLTEAVNPTMTFVYHTPYYSSSYTSTGYTNELKVLVLTEAQGQDAGANGTQLWTNGSIYTTWWANSPQVDLSAYQGQKIYIAFENTPKYGNATSIDYVQITSDATTYTTGVSWADPIIKGGIEFLATADGNWNEGSNWSTGEVPSATDKVTIKGNAVITENVNINTITIADGASLTLESGVLTAEIINNKNAEAFVIEDGAQLFQNNSDVAATFNMGVVNPTGEWSNSNQTGWQFVASPFTDATIASFLPSEGDYDLYKYDGTQDLEWVNHKQHAQGGDEFTYNFENGVMPSEFILIDANGDGYNWGVSGDGNTYYSLGSAYIGSNGCLYSEANYYGTDRNPDNYIVLPKSNIIEGSNLKFKARSYYSYLEYGYSEYFEVLVSDKKSATVEDFETVFGPEQNTGDYNGQTNKWTEYTIDLSQYAGKEIYIAIRHHNPDATSRSLLMLDDIELLSGSFVPFDETLANGKAYLASYETETVASLEGTLNNASSHTWNLSYDAEKPLANFHLLGNPFTFDMDVTAATYNNLVEGVAIVTSEGGYDYSQTTIPVGDGFFVKAIGENPSLSYGGRGARSVKSNNSLNITATGNAGEDNVIINLAGKSEGFDKLQNFNDAIATVYVAEDGKNYGIYNCDADVQEVELSFNANQMGNYTISIEPNGKFQTVTLVDRFTGIETNMLVEDYHFTAMSNVNTNRFIVRMVNGQQTTDNSHFVFQSGEDLIIDAEGTVQIIDVMGRVLVSDDVESTNNRINVSGFQNGTYMVRVINGSEVKVEKVVIY